MRKNDNDSNKSLQNSFPDAAQEIGEINTELAEGKHQWRDANSVLLTPLKYTQEIGNTTYIIRTHFNEDGIGDVYDTVSRLMKKRNKQRVL